MIDRLDIDCAAFAARSHERRTKGGDVVINGNRIIWAAWIAANIANYSQALIIGKQRLIDHRLYRFAQVHTVDEHIVFDSRSERLSGAIKLRQIPSTYLHIPIETLDKIRRATATAA